MKRILVVDDDSIMCATIREILQAEGYEVCEANDGRGAMSLLRSMHIDMIITDILMPDKDGIEIILESRKLYPKLIILAISGGGYITADNYLSMAKDLGAHTTMAKPFDIDRFIGEVNRLLVNPLSVSQVTVD